MEPIDWRTKISTIKTDSGVKLSLSPVLNQENCGNCWALSSTSVLTDRFIIQKRIAGLQLAAEVTTQCAFGSACGGGSPQYAADFFENVGVNAVEKGCPSWAESYSSTGLPSCQDLADKCAKSTLYKALPDSTISLAGSPRDIINSIKADLANGPLVASFQVPYDFMVSSLGYSWDETNGIYIFGAYDHVLDQYSESMKQASSSFKGTWSDIDGGHAVSIVGWGRGNAGSYGTVDYWIVRNSWGTDWMENGFFRFATSENGLNSTLGFDAPNSSGYGCTTFLPDLSSGANNGHVYPPSDGQQSGSNKLWFYIGIGVVAIVILAILLQILFG